MELQKKELYVPTPRKGVFGVSILRKIKKYYFSDLKEKPQFNFTDNSVFQKTAEPLLSNTLVYTDKVNLTENGGIVISDKEKARTLNSFFNKCCTKP